MATVKKQGKKPASKKSKQAAKRPIGVLPTGNTAGTSRFAARTIGQAKTTPEAAQDFTNTENAVYEETEREKFMSIGDHLEELRIRLLWIIGILVVTSSVIGIFIEDIHSFLIAPYQAVLKELPNNQAAGGLILGSVYGSLEIYFKLAIMLGLLVTLPVALSLLWGFVTPAVTKKVARIGQSVVASSTLLFWGGVTFAWVYIFPLSLDMMLKTFLPEGVLAQTSLEKYYSFLFMIVLGSGITFQLPMVVVLLGAIGIVPFSYHRKIWKMVLMATLVFSAFFTPPDPFSLFALAVPLWALYALSIGIVWIIEKGRRKDIAQAPA